MNKLKKDGAGGKHSWGKPGIELKYLHNLSEGEEENKDPIFDEKSQEQYIQNLLDRPEYFKFLDYNNELKEFKNPFINESRLLEALKHYREIAEFSFNSNNPKLLFKGFKKSIASVHSIIIKRAIQVALEKGETFQIILMEYLYNAYILSLISKEAIRRGIDYILSSLGDLLIDTPNCIEPILFIIRELILQKLLPSDYSIRIPDSLITLPQTKSLFNELVSPNSIDIEKRKEIKVKLALMSGDMIATNNIDDAIELFSKNDMKPFRSTMIRKLIETSYDRNNSEKEICSLILVRLKHEAQFDIYSYSYAFDDLLEVY